MPKNLSILKEFINSFINVFTRNIKHWEGQFAIPARFFLEWISCFLMHVFLGNWQNIFLSYQENFFGQSRTFLCWRRTFLIRGGLFSIGGGLFSIGVGLFLSPTVTEKKSSSNGKKSYCNPKKVLDFGIFRWTWVLKSIYGAVDFGCWRSTMLQDNGSFLSLIHLTGQFFG